MRMIRIIKAIKSLSLTDLMMLAAVVMIVILSLKLRDATNRLSENSDTIQLQVSERAKLSEQLLQETMKTTGLMATIVEQRKAIDAERLAREAASTSLNETKNYLKAKEATIRELLRKDSKIVRDCYDTPAPAYVIARVFGSTDTSP